MERPINAGPEGGDDKGNAGKTRDGRGFEQGCALGGGGAHKLGMPLRAQDRVVLGVTVALGRIGHARCYNITPDKDKGCVCFAPCFGKRYFSPRFWGGNQMPDVETLSVALTSEQAAAIRDAVASGEYASANDAIRDAIQDWRIKRSHHGDVQRLRQLWDEGVESGSAGLVDMDALRREARKRLEAASKA